MSVLPKLVFAVVLILLLAGPSLAVIQAPPVSQAATAADAISAQARGLSNPGPLLESALAEQPGLALDNLVAQEGEQGNNGNGKGKDDDKDDQDDDDHAVSPG